MKITCKGYGPAFLAAAVMIFLSGTGQAGDLSLQEAVDTALAHNPLLAAEQFNETAGKEKVGQARSAFLPDIRLSEQASRTVNPMWAFGTRLNQQAITAQDFDPDRLNDPDALNNYATVLSFNWMLYDSGQARHSLEQARLNLESARLLTKKKQQAVITDTVSAYLQVLLTLEKEQVLKQMQETAASHLKLVQSRYDGGFVAKSDLLRAQVRMADLTQQATQVANSREMVLCALNTAMGTGRYIPHRLTTPMAQGDKLSGSIEEWVKTAGDNRPELEQSRLFVRIAEQELDKAKALRHPSFGVSGSYEINTEDFDQTGSNYTIGAQVSLPLYTGGRIPSKIREALALSDRAKSLLKATRQQVCAEARAAFLTALSAWERIHVARSAIGQSEESLRIVRNRYEGGLFTITDLLDTQVLVQQSRTDYLSAVYDYLAAVNRLSLASGTASQASLLEVREP